MSYKYDKPDDAYREAQRRIKRAKDGSFFGKVTKTITDMRGKLLLKGLGLTKVPPEIGQLSNLEHLWLGDNQLTTVPPEIGQLTNLQGLWLSNNLLTSIPSEIGQLYNLKNLSLSQNQLKAIPYEISQLDNLQGLWINNNQLITIPFQFSQLYNLRSFDLSHNQLTVIPPEIGQLYKLNSLDLRSNPNLSIPLKIMKQHNSPQIILGYLRASQTQVSQTQVLDKIRPYQSELPSRRQILRILHTFERGEFYTLLYELNINRDDLAGESVTDQKRECVLYMENRDRLAELLTAIAEKRPFANLQ